MERSLDAKLEVHQLFKQHSGASTSRASQSWYSGHMLGQRSAALYRDRFKVQLFLLKQEINKKYLLLQQSRRERQRRLRRRDKLLAKLRAAAPDASASTSTVIAQPYPYISSTGESGDGGGGTHSVVLRWAGTAILVPKTSTLFPHYPLKHNQTRQ